MNTKKSRTLAMKNSSSIGAICACIVFVSISVNAATIVDTGPGPGPIPGSGWSLTSTQFLAAEFNIGSDTTISSIEGWMNLSLPGTRSGTIAIYSDGGDIPGTEIHSTTFFSSHVLGEPFIRSWIGSSGLSWFLPIGTYWVAFEVRPDQSLSAAMGAPSETPLLNEAFWHVGNGRWIGRDDLSLGIRISSVPIPASAWLFGSSLLGLVGIARRKSAV